MDGPAGLKARAEHLKRVVPQRRPLASLMGEVWISPHSKVGPQQPSTPAHRPLGDVIWPLMGVLRRRLITHPARAQGVVRPHSVPSA